MVFKIIFFFIIVVLFLAFMTEFSFVGSAFTTLLVYFTSFMSYLGQFFLTLITSLLTKPTLLIFVSLGVVIILSSLIVHWIIAPIRHKGDD